MDIQAYISSGILESYILGTASSQEKQEVECMSHIYPEIKEELHAIELAMESFAFKSKKIVPTHVKTNLFAAIENVPQEQEEQEKIIASPKEAKIVALESEVQSSSSWKWLAAAAVIGFIITASLLYSMNRQQNQYVAQLENAAAEKQLLENTLASVIAEMKITQEQLAFISNENTAKIILKGTEAHPETQSTVYWNPNTKKGMMSIQNLPVPPTEQDYQLWAIVDGSPVDMGIVTINPETNTLQTIPDVEGAQAFAITLEKKGGSPTPNLEQLYVIGNT